MISIVTATYNSKDDIIQTYESIKNQTTSDWEWLVTDDCSLDETYAKLNEISSYDKRVKIFKNAMNSGAAVARNNSIMHATGDFIAFLDSDDIWVSNKLELQLKFMGSEIDFSFTSYELIDQYGRPSNKIVDNHKKISFNYEDMLRKKATLGCSTVILRRCAFDELSMPLIRTGQDYATWLKLLKTGKNAYKLNKVLTHYRIRPDSISRNKIKKAMRQWEIYRNIEQLSLKKSLVCFYLYAWRAIFRR